MQTIEQARAEQEVAEREAAEAKDFLTFFRGRPELATDANMGLIKSFIGAPATLATIREAVEFLGDKLGIKRDKQILEEAEHDRATLLETLKKLTGNIPQTIKYQTTEEIRANVEEIQRRKELEMKSPEELRQIIKDGKPAPALPPIPSEMTRHYLINLPAVELRRAVDKYGRDAVNARLVNQG